MSIPTTLDDLSRRTTVYVIGGLIAGILSGMAFLLILLVHGVVFTVTETRLLPTGVWYAFSALNWMMFAFVLISLVLYDGPRLLKLFIGGDKSNRWVALRSLTAFDAAGYRPSKWPSPLISQALVHPDNSKDELAAQRLAYLAALDGGDRDQAREHMERMLQVAWKQAQSLQADYKAEAAFYEAFVSSNPSTARAYLSQTDTVTRRHALHRAEAAVLLAEGDRPGASKAIAQASSALSKSIEPGIAVAEAEWLRMLQAPTELASVPVDQHDQPPEPLAVESPAPSSLSPQIPRLRKIEL